MKWKINSLQYSSILALLIYIPILGIGTHSIINIAKNDAYLSTIITAILGIIVLLLFNYIHSYDKNNSISTTIINLYGKVLGTIINLIICSIFLIISITYLYNLSNFITSQFLNQTPSIIIIISITILIAYNLSKGFQNMSRVSLILFTITLILYILTFIFLMPHTDINKLKPLLSNNITSITKAGINLTFTNILPIFALLCIPKNNIKDNQKLNKYITIFYIIAISLCIIVITATISTLGIYLTKMYQYPEYITLKEVNLLGFIERSENILSIQWILGYFVAISLFIYYISSTIKIKEDTPNNIITIIILIVTIYLTRKIFKNNTMFNYYIINIFHELNNIYKKAKDTKLVSFFYIKYLMNFFTNTLSRLVETMSFIFTC